MGLRAESARPQRVSGSARTSRRAESARNPIATHAKFGDYSAMNALTRGQWTVALSEVSPEEARRTFVIDSLHRNRSNAVLRTRYRY